MIEWSPQFTVSVITMTGAAAMILSIILLRLTLDPRVRRYAIPPDWEYTAFPDFYLKGIARAIIFGLCCVFPHVNNADMYRRMYNNIDVKAFANPFEKFLGWGMTTGITIFALGGVVIFTTKSLGIWVWE